MKRPADKKCIQDERRCMISRHTPRCLWVPFSHVLNETGNGTRGTEKARIAIDRRARLLRHNLSRGLRRNQSNLIGVIIPDIMNPFFPAVVRGVEDLAFKSNYRVLLCNADNDVKKEAAYLLDLQSFLLPASS